MESSRRWTDRINVSGTAKTRRPPMSVRFWRDGDVAAVHRFGGCGHVGQRRTATVGTFVFTVTAGRSAALPRRIHHTAWRTAVAVAGSTAVAATGGPCTVAPAAVRELFVLFFKAGGTELDLFLLLASNVAQPLLLAISMVPIAPPRGLHIGVAPGDDLNTAILFCSV